MKLLCRTSVKRGSTLIFYVDYVTSLINSGFVMISKELVGASARSILLSILERGDSYGYAILRSVRELSNGEVEWKDGMLYPVLHRLEDEKLIKSVWVQIENGRKRKYYKLLAKGRKGIERQKKEWLQVDSVLAQLWGWEPRFAV